MSKMYDMGYKLPKGEGPIPAEGSSESNMLYPSMHIDKKIPEDLRSKDVGEMCRLEVVGKVVSKSENDRGESMSIEVHKMGYIGKGGKVTKDEYLDMDEDKREEYDKRDTGVDEVDEEEK